MSNLTGFAPISKVVPLPEFLRSLLQTGIAGDVANKVGLIDFQLSADSSGGATLNATLGMSEEVSFAVPGLPSLAVVLGLSDSTPLSNFNLRIPLRLPLGVTIAKLGVTIRVSSDLLVAAELDDAGNWVARKAEDGSLRPLEIRLTAPNIVIDGDGDVDLNFDDPPSISLDPFMIGSTGLVVEVSEPIAFYLSHKSAPPPGQASGFRGVYIPQAKLHLPWFKKASKPVMLELIDCAIGKGGFSGGVAAELSLTGEFFGMAATLQSCELIFVDNVPVQCRVAIELQLPFFDCPVNVDLSIDHGGSVLLKLSVDQPPNVTSKNGLITFEKQGVMRMAVESLAFSWKKGLAVVTLSGEATPLFAAEGIKWPTFDIQELSIDSVGHVHFKGGFTALPKAYTLEFYGAKVEITQFNMGHTDDGGKFIALSGSVELVKNIPAGASVEGLRIVWYDDNRDPKLTFKGIGVEFAIPKAIEFKGHVSYEKSGDDHRFTGDLEVTLPSIDLKLIGKAVFGSTIKNGERFKYFAIYLEGDFGTGIPLFSTGVSLYGFAGLLAINYSPDKPPEMMWYAIDKSKSWFHKPEKGITDFQHKWQPERHALAVGAGVTIGTTNDSGYSFSGKFLLLVICPGPVIMLEGSIRFLAKKDDPSEPPFHSLIVLDNRAGSFLIGVDAKYKCDKNTGKLVDISGSMEAYFSFHDPMAWHLWIGKRDPAEQRIQASILSAFTANSYFMLDARQLALGAWVGKNDHYRWGPVSADMEAWLDTNALVNFKPAHFHADLTIHGYFAIRVFRFKLGFGLDAYLSADVFKPFHILGTLNIRIETWIKDFDIELRLEWGPRVEAPDLKLPEFLPIESYGLAHPKSSLEWPYEANKTPLVPMDVRPYVTFGYPIHDEIGVGVNAAPNPGWQTIGNPVTGAGSARVMYRLIGIRLYDTTSGAPKLLAERPKVSTAPDVGEIYGSWAPSPTGSAGKQNKLLIWSKNPLDFGNKSDSWNPWLSSNLPNYPCPSFPEPWPQICIDFGRFGIGKTLYGVWRHPEKPDFQIDWSDGKPKPIGVVPRSISTIGVGLNFPPAAPRKRYRAYMANRNANNVVLLDLETRKILATIPTGTSPRDIAISPDGKRAYVCHDGAGTLVVIDTATNTVIGTPIPVVKAPVSIVLSPDGSRAFVPSGAENAMSVVDLQSLKVVSTIKLQGTSNRAVLSPDGKKGYVLHGPSGKISVFSPQTSTVTKVVDAPGGPNSMVFHPTEAKAWVSLPGKGSVRLFDVLQDQMTPLETVTGKWPLELAISPDGLRLYVGNLQSNTVSVLDSLSLDVRATVSTPGPWGIETTPDGSLVLVANSTGDGVTVIDAPTSRIVGARIPTGKGSRAAAVVETPPATESIAYVANQFGNSISVVDMQTRMVVSSIAVGKGPTQVMLAPDGKRLYTCCEQGNVFQIIDTTSNTLIAGLELGIRAPYSFTLSMDGARAFVISAQQKGLTVIDLATVKVTATVPDTLEANHIVLSNDGTKCYLANRGAISVFRTDTLKVTKIAPAPAPIQGIFQRIALHPSRPFAFASCREEGSVRGFDLVAEAFNAMVLITGAFARDICISPDGLKLYVANIQANTVSVIDTAKGQVVATIPVANPVGPVFSADGAQLIVPSLHSGTISTINPATNQVVGTTISNPGGPNSVANLIRPKVEKPLPGVPVEVIIDVPKGSSVVEVTWIGNSALRGNVPASVAPKTISADPGTVLKLIAKDFGLMEPGKEKGIDKIRLVNDSSWTLIRVCVTKPPVEGGVAELARVREALKQQVDLWQKPAVVLAPDRKYEIVIDVTGNAEGLGELAGWGTDISDQRKIPFQTAQPPALPTVPITLPSGKQTQATGLEDLSLYVSRTIPLSQTPKNERPKLMKPVFRGYDVTVEFNENYVDQLYSLAARDLDLILFDGNNQPVRDAEGRLVLIEDAWDNAPELNLTETQARWVEMLKVAGGPCAGLALDPTKIQTNKRLGSRVAQVLEPDTVFEARLIPRLTRKLVLPTVADWTKDGAAFETWAAGGTWPNKGADWNDYRVSVLALLATADPVTIFFRQIGGDRYEFTINPKLNQRILTVVKGSALIELAKDYYNFKPGTDQPYRLRVEAIGSALLVTQNDEVVFRVDIATLQDVHNKLLAKGTAGLRRPAGQQDLFKDFGISDLRAGAPVAYRFQFTTSIFANFCHLIHSHQGEIWRASMDGGPSVSELLSKVGTDQEWRAYEDFSNRLLGPGPSAQDPPSLEVTRVDQSGALLGWLIRSPEPIDRERTSITLSVTDSRLPRGTRPSGVKICATELGTQEAVTLVTREAFDLSGCTLQYLQMPAAIDGQRSHRILWRNRPDELPISAALAFGDASWADYRVKATIRTTHPGEIGFRFRQVDDKNYYSFVVVPETGQKKIIKTTNGVSVQLVNATGGPMLGRIQTMALSVVGPKMVAYIGETQVLEASDSDFIEGGVGVVASPDSQADLLSLQVLEQPSETYALYRGTFSSNSMAGWTDVQDGSGLKIQSVGTPNWTDYLVSARVKVSNTIDTGIVFRFVDALNHYRYVFGTTGRRLERIVAGVSTVLWRASGDSPGKRPFDLAFVLKGSSISILQDSVFIGEVVDTQLPVGSVGACALPGASFEMSQVFVYPVVSPSSRWAFIDEFAVWEQEQWTIVDEGLNGPSKWGVDDGHLVQTVPVSDSDSVRQRGTIAVRNRSSLDAFRLVVELSFPTTGSTGVVLGYQDPMNFTRLSFEANKPASRLVRVSNGAIEEIWTEARALDFGPHILTVDSTDGHLRAWLDGDQLFHLHTGDIKGVMGLYCSGTGQASFRHLRIGSPTWVTYHQFGFEQRLPAGHRIKISPSNSPQSQDSIDRRSPIEPGEDSIQRLPANGAKIRVATADGRVAHSVATISSSNFSVVPTQALWEADGTGVLLIPTSPVSIDTGVRIDWRYERDNRVVDPTAIIFTAGGSSAAEDVILEIVSETAN